MLERRVERTLRDRELVQRGSRVLAACSGGPDSAAMLGALHALRHRVGHDLVAVASVDHGLRAEACRDVAVAREQSERLGVPFHALRVTLEAGASLQAQARRARYAVLHRLAHELGADRIAVGHTLDDQAETVLQRVLRGAGIEALAGIEPRRADGVIRPLIDCSRDESRAYALRFFGRVVDDASNRDPRFLRARVREELLPLMHREDPAVVRHLAALADDARAHRESLARRAESLLAVSLREGELVLASLLEGERVVFRAALRRWAEHRLGEPPGHSALDQLEQVARRGRGQVWLPGGYVGHAAEGRLSLEQAAGPGRKPRARGETHCGKEGSASA